MPAVHQGFLPRIFSAVVVVALLVVPAGAQTTGGDSGPSPTPSPVAIPFEAGRAIYVLGSGGDATTKATLVSRLAHYLQGYQLDAQYILAEPNWVLSDFVKQCKEDHTGNTVGALVVTFVPAISATHDGILRRRTWTEVDGSVMYAKCADATHLASYVWASHIDHGIDWHSQNTPLPALAFALTLGSAVLTFTPSKTSTSAATRIFPTTPPLPPDGKTSQIVTTTQSQTNASQLGALSTSLLAQSLNYTNASISATMTSNFEQISNAEWNLVYSLVYQMNCPAVPDPSATPVPKNTPQPESRPSPAPFCATK